MSTKFVFVDGNLTLLIKGSSKTVNAEHPNYDAIREGLKSGLSEDAMSELVERASADVVLLQLADDLTDGEVTIKNGELFYDGEKVDDHINEYLNDLVNNDLPTDGIINHVKRLYGNVSARVKRELLSFSQRNGLTVDSEGFLIAYKAVQEDYLDIYSSTISYKPGAVVTMKRGKVDDDFTRGCSKGLHAGSLDYVYSYGRGDARIVIVKIDPADVVSVPSDCGCAKLRTCKMTVIGDYQGELQRTAYAANATVDDMYEDDLEDEEVDDFDWDDVEDMDEDDSFDDGDVISIIETIEVEVVKECATPSDCGCYGTKPESSSQAGRKFHNKRGPNGRFA